MFNGEEALLEKNKQLEQKPMLDTVWYPGPETKHGVCGQDR